LILDAGFCPAYGGQAAADKSATRMADKCRMQVLSKNGQKYAKIQRNLHFLAKE